jgi:hypothetical protein
MVDGEPFLVRGGELGNSTASDLDGLEPFWAGFGDLGLNTVLAPVYWERIEPAEGDLDPGTTAPPATRFSVAPSPGRSSTTSDAAGRGDPSTGAGRAGAG